MTVDGDAGMWMYHDVLYMENGGLRLFNGVLRLVLWDFYRIYALVMTNSFLLKFAMLNGKTHCSGRLKRAVSVVSDCDMI